MINFIVEQDNGKLPFAFLGHEYNVISYFESLANLTQNYCTVGSVTIIVVTSELDDSTLLKLITSVDSKELLLLFIGESLQSKKESVHALLRDNKMNTRYMFVANNEDVQVTINNIVSEVSCTLLLAGNKSIEITQISMHDDNELIHSITRALHESEHDLLLLESYDEFNGYSLRTVNRKYVLAIV